MREYVDLIAANKKWAKSMVEKSPEFFTKNWASQSPKFLWIGCADSRVPAEQITQLEPGHLFVHRNIANMVVHTDLNMLSVLQYAVEVLKIRHIIVCGHYNCGGVKAALTDNSLGLIDNWLRNIKDVYRFNKHELDNLKDEEKKLNKLIELNVKEQVNNLAKTPIVQKQWSIDKAPYLHGWVYNMKDGLVNPVLDIEPGQKLSDDIYRYKF